MDKKEGNTTNRKFFNNDGENSLFKKLEGIANDDGMGANFHSFLAVVGYFRSSGYFKLRKELKNAKKIKILVGINVDKYFSYARSKALLIDSKQEAKAREQFKEEFQTDVLREAKYCKEVEGGVLQLVEDLKSGKLEMRLHPSKRLHAKFYLCLPEKHSSHSDGWVIMGSSNISEQGLGISQPPQYELNVALKDYDDVHFCHKEFQKLWEEGHIIEEGDINNAIKNTYLDVEAMPTPYELYMKVLIDTFGSIVEDKLTIDLPKGIRELKYQTDAVLQGYQMLLQHNGVFLADVVGLGKTYIATMIAKRYIEENGSKYTSILVVHPPSLKATWKESFELFGIHKKAHFISIGSLDKVLDGKDRYFTPDKFDLIIVDEAHRFRNDNAAQYEKLQKICKAPCSNKGLLKSSRKRVLLLSATPLNNKPDDIKNLLLLFQDGYSSTIDGIPNINSFFKERQNKYEKLSRKNEEGSSNINEVDKIYNEIRTHILDKVTIRRTRSNILNEPSYKEDIEKQGISFPKVHPPKKLVYTMEEKISTLFFDTLTMLTDGKTNDNPNGQGLEYARYRVVEFLEESLQKDYPMSKSMSRNLAGIYRTNMVKRLESSFYAFKRSLDSLFKSTKRVRDMLDEDCVTIAPQKDLDIIKMLEKGEELDTILSKEERETGGKKEKIKIYKATDFIKDLSKLLDHDLRILQDLIKKWNEIEQDPKYDIFKEKLETELFNKAINPSQKLVVFSESIDTIKYLENKLKEDLNRKDILLVTSKNRHQLMEKIKASFDANYSNPSDEYNIILSTDVLAEGINLHRANVVINYDSPWNASILLQRLGRVNRIGTEAKEIHNYLFYPSRQGDSQINLYKNALNKLQGIHSALGEDYQVFSEEEQIRVYELYDKEVKDIEDERIALLREVRELYHNNHKLYKKIKRLPPRSRTARDSHNHDIASEGQSIIYLSSPYKSEFYLVTTDSKPHSLDMLEALKYLKAEKSEAPLPIPKDNDFHYLHVQKAEEEFINELLVIEKESSEQSISLNKDNADKNTNRAIKILTSLQREYSNDFETKDASVALQETIKSGMYNNLCKKIIDLKKKTKKKLEKEEETDSLREAIIDLASEYQLLKTTPDDEELKKNIQPTILLSETFL